MPTAYRDYRQRWCVGAESLATEHFDRSPVPFETAVATVSRDSSASAENRERPGTFTGKRFIAGGSRGAVDDHSCRGADHGTDLGAGSGRSTALFFDQVSDQLLLAVGSGEKFRQHGLHGF